MGLHHNTDAFSANSELSLRSPSLAHCRLWTGESSFQWALYDLGCYSSLDKPVESLPISSKDSRPLLRRLRESFGLEVTFSFVDTAEPMLQCSRVSFLAFIQLSQSIFNPNRFPSSMFSVFLIHGGLSFLSVSRI